MDATPQFQNPNDAPMAEAFDIAWHYVSTAYGLDEEDLVPQAFLAVHIMRAHERGEHRTIALANRAISAYVKSADPAAEGARSLRMA